MNRYIVLNSGSSSIKFQCLEMPSQKVIAKALVEKIGADDAEFHFDSNKGNRHEVRPIFNHEEGLNLITETLLGEELGVIESVDEIESVGHRVVHGGSTFSDPTFVTQAVKDKIRELFTLAPLHNPANLEGIEVAENIFPNAKQIAVFDTAFHQTLPPKAFTYAIPKCLAEEEKIRVYGFHGVSHAYVSQQAIQYLNQVDSKLISIHLGNGCSMTAIESGVSKDHSLGFGPISGLVMGTRTGDIDPLVLLYLMQEKGYSVAQANELITKKSGMLGLTNFSDLREIEAEAAKGNKDCQLALEINAYRVKKYIGAYAAAMNGVDALIFTAGIGENSSTLRRMICEEMEFIGISISSEKNEIRSSEILEIQGEDSKVKILVIPTNEELEIAQQMQALL